jgi:hypothetical protein
MRTYFLFSLLLVIISGANAQFSDTLFVSGDTISKDYHVIFIDTPHSKFHNLLFEYLLPKASAQQHNPPSKSHFEYGLGKSYTNEWLTVHQFKGKFYAYLPSEPYFNTYIQWIDSNLIINDFNEGEFVSYQIVITKRKKKKVILQVSSTIGERHKLKISRKKKMLYVIKSSIFNQGKLFFVERTHFYDFPIIVNYCPYGRCSEFRFE